MSEARPFWPSWKTVADDCKHVEFDGGTHSLAGGAEVVLNTGRGPYRRNSLGWVREGTEEYVASLPVTETTSPAQFSTICAEFDAEPTVLRTRDTHPNIVLFGEHAIVATNAALQVAREEK